MAFGRKSNNGNSTTPNSTRSHSLTHPLLRLLQFLSALTSLILFSLRLAKIIRLAHRASHSNGAVEGILVAAALFTLIATLLSFGIKLTRSNTLRWAFLVLDVLFVGAFIAVAVLTSPKRHGSSSPCTSSAKIYSHLPGSENCKLPWGTFILAIISTILHAITAAYHAIKDRHTKNDRAYDKDAYNNGYHNGHQTHDARVGNGHGAAPGV